MSISLLGVLPVSGINTGLALGIPAIDAEVTKLGEDIIRLQGAIPAQADVALNPPTLDGLFAVRGDLLAAIPAWDPANIITGGADVNADAAIKLGLIDAQLALVGNIKASFQAGLDTGGLSLWTYAGRAAGFGTQLQAQTQNGYPGAGSTEEVQALIIATESPTSWGNFSANFNTGTTAELNPADLVSSERLTFEGTFTGGQLNTGVLDASLPIDLFLLELEGLRASLELQLQVSVGLNLPSLDLLAELAVDVDLELALDAVLNVSIDLLAEIDLINLRIQFLLDLIARLSLDAGGLAVWKYSGPASGLGAAFVPEIATGIPGGGGPDVGSYGVVISTKLPSAWAAFGLIFLTG